MSENWDGMLGSWHDSAQICLNGHVINEMADSNPVHNKKFCDICGERTITQCPHCNENIRGYYWEEGTPVSRPPAVLRKYCHNCGKPYPWTESLLKAAHDLADDLENLTAEERDKLKRSIDDLVREQPNVQVASLRFKRLMAKAGKAVAQSFKEILVDIVSETVKKTIWK